MSSLSSQHGSDSLSHFSIPNFQLQIPSNREQWRQWRINFEAYAGSNKFLTVLNGTYIAYDDPVDFEVKDKGGTRKMTVTDSYWQFYQKHIADKETHVAKAWNAIITIATAHHSHLIRNHYSEPDLEKRVKKCWDNICNHMEHKETGIKKSVILSKFSSAKLIDTGNFCADVINFRDELNRWRSEADGLGITIDGEVVKTHFKLGLPSTHQHNSIRDIFRRYEDKDWDEFHEKVINDLQEEEILNEVQESMIPSSKTESRKMEALKEITDPNTLKANIAEMQRKLALYGKSHQDTSKLRITKKKGFKVDNKIVGKYSKFTGKCHTCGKIGHKSADCFHRKDREVDVKTDNKLGDSQCPICKKRGHTADKCWFKDGKRRGTFKEGTEKENPWKGKSFITFKDGTQAEYLETNDGLGEED